MDSNIFKHGEKTGKKPNSKICIGLEGMELQFVFNFKNKLILLGID
jgi:hypothetical protein